jgi:hypothetical protein
MATFIVIVLFLACVCKFGDPIDNLKNELKRDIIKGIEEHRS